MELSYFFQILNNPYVQDVIVTVGAATIGKAIKKFKDKSLEKQLFEALSKSFKRLNNEYDLRINTNNIELSVFKKIDSTSIDKAKSILASALQINIDKVDEKMLESWINAFYREITNPKYNWAFNYLNLYSLTFIENAVEIMNTDLGKGNYSAPQSYLDHHKNNFDLQSTTSFEQLFKKAFLAFRNITNTDYNQLILFTKYNNHTSGLIVYAEDIPAHKQNYLLVVQEGLIYKAFTEKDNQIFNYLYNKETYFEAVLQTESEIAVPIKDENTVYGVLNSESERNNHYHKNMIDGISELATELAKNLKRLGFSSTLSPQDLPHLHYENGIFQKLKFTNRT